MLLTLLTVRCVRNASEARQQGVRKSRGVSGASAGQPCQPCGRRGSVPRGCQTGSGWGASRRAAQPVQPVRVAGRAGWTAQPLDGAAAGRGGRPARRLAAAHQKRAANERQKRQKPAGYR